MSGRHGQEKYGIHACSSESCRLAIIYVQSTHVQVPPPSDIVSVFIHIPSYYTL